MADLSGIRSLAEQGNPFARRVVEELDQAHDDNERKEAIARLIDEWRPVIHLAVDLAQSLGLSAAAANARANR
jgi:hypothetical protein